MGVALDGNRGGKAGGGENEFAVEERKAAFELPVEPAAKKDRKKEGGGEDAERPAEDRALFGGHRRRRKIGLMDV